MPSSFHHFQVDLFQLQVNTLRRYKRHYKLQTRPGLNKAQLAEVSEDSSGDIFATRKLFISSVQGHVYGHSHLCDSLVQNKCPLQGFRE